MTSKTHVLRIKNLQGYYGESHVLHGMNFSVEQGEVVTLLGRNGAGKTTTLKAIIGLLEKRSGSILINEVESIRLSPNRIANLGVAYCPEERGIFASLSVAENLQLPPRLKPGGYSDADVYELFPRLKERSSSQGTKLSGGEQQMLAIARIIRTGATILLLDEPTEGLAPVIVKQIGALIKTLKARGFTILLVEQNFHFACKVADRHYVVEHGQVVDEILASDVQNRSADIRSYLGV